jgi:hypothetical protein
MNDFAEDNADTHVIDIDNVAEATRELLPAAWYNCVISDHEYDLSQASSQPMWKMKLNVEDGEYTGRVLYYNMSFSPKALPYTKPTISKCFPDLLSDPQWRSGSNLDTKKIGDEGALDGRRVRVRVGYQKYENEKRNTVKELAPPQDANAFTNFG